MGAAAALLWRRRLAMSGGVAPQELLGSPRWPSWMGTAAAVGGQTAAAGLRRHAAQTRHSPRTRTRIFSNKARRAFVVVGHSYAFARQMAFTEAAGGRR